MQTPSSGDNMSGPSGFFTAMAGDDAQQLYSNASISLGKYIGYMEKAIQAQKAKNITCRWELVEKPGLKLSAKNKLYQIIPQTEIRFLNVQEGWATLHIKEEDESDLKSYGIDLSKRNISWGRGAGSKSHELSSDEIRKNDDGDYQIKIGDLNPDPEIFWQNYNFNWDRCKTISETDTFYYNGSKVDVKRGGKEERTYYIFEILDVNKKILVNGIETHFEIIQKFDEKKFTQSFRDVASKIDNYWFVVGKKPEFQCCSITEITNSALKDLKVSELMLNNQALRDSEWTYNSESHILTNESNKRDKNIKGLEFSHTLYKNWGISGNNNIHQDKWIQLLEDQGENYDPEVIEQSPLEYFFDDSVDIFASVETKETDRYEITGKRPDDYQIKIRKKNDKYDSFPEKDRLYLKANIRELLNQQEALRKLETKPFPENLPLLNLMKDRDKHHWDIFQPLRQPPEDYWLVLTDPNFKGCDKQRDFVLTALATPDFAILDGPPGTGKTTTIRELILQLVKEGKRILLAASTNAAINNVLERLRDEDKDKAPIHATRLGTKDRAHGVEEYVLDEQCDEWSGLDLDKSSIKQLIIESANLVCGTTSGIHKLFNKDYKKDEKDPSENLTRNGAPFDVMIIDECSKTTFQEFVVPGRLAKKWILVGDIRQLSPFTDRSQIVTNLKHIEGATPALQKACNLLFHTYPYSDKIIVPAEKAVIDQILNEIESRINNDSSENKLLKENVYLILDEDVLKKYPEYLYSKNVIFITDSLFETYNYMMPQDAIVLSENWMQTNHAFRHYSQPKWSDGHTYKYRGKTCSSAKDVHDCIIELTQKKTWADEICWRLERVHWLRYSKKHGDNYQNQIDRLLPKSIKVGGSVNWIKNIAFPSILESLSTDGQKLGWGIFNTLTKGFKDDELNCRSVTLTYQHRMHPEISEPPRKLFYSESGYRKNNSNERSLLDGDTLKKRSWEYNGYKSRRTWIDCNGKIGKNNSNEMEAARIIEEVKKFGDWAKEYWNGENEPEIAILTFYTGQEAVLREKLRKLPGMSNKLSRFSYNNCSIRLATVDFFQGQEADIVFLSMVNTYRDGFLDTPNRLNVAITRARHQMVIIGKYDYFRNDSKTWELKKLAEMYEE